MGMMAVGGYVGWRLTRGMDDKKGSLREEAAQASLPGLVTRGADGTWGLGTPVPRPMENPALAPATGGVSMGFDLAAGRF